MSDQFSAWQLILNGDPALFAIVRLSLAVSLSAVALAALIGMPLGALLGLARFRRAAAEVGAVMIVGGNIDGFTRTMTTAVALETSKGNLPLAMGLGVILLAIVLAINAAAWGTRVWSERQAG